MERVVARLRRAGAVRELALIEIEAAGEMRARVIEVTSIFHGRLLDATAHTLTIEITGVGDEIDALIELLQDFGEVRVARSGPLALA